MSEVFIDMTQVHAWQLALKGKAVSYPVTAGQIIYRGANRILDQTRTNILNAPPPKRKRPKRRKGPPFGETFRMEFSHSGTFIDAAVGTDVVYGWRFEMGFVGADSAGRHYDQIPRPVLGPAADLVEPEIVVALAIAAERVP